MPCSFSQQYTHSLHHPPSTSSHATHLTNNSKMPGDAKAAKKEGE